MSNARTRYMSDAVVTANPTRLLTMLYDRLLVDLDRASVALADADDADARPRIEHAQDIVCELMDTLDVDAWDGADRLMAIYTFVLQRLLHAGATGDAGALADCRGLLEPLALAWHEAADEVGRAAVPTQRGDEVPTPGLLGVG